MEQTNTINNYYNVYYPLDWDSMLKKANYSEDILKQRTKKYIHEYSHYNMGNNIEVSKQLINVLVALIDFFFAYGKKKNVNPIICILQVVHETGWMKDSLHSSDGTYLKNIGGVKVNNYIFPDSIEWV